MLSTVKRLSEMTIHINDERKKLTMYYPEETQSRTEATTSASKRGLILARDSPHPRAINGVHDVD